MKIFINIKNYSYNKLEDVFWCFVKIMFYSIVIGFIDLYLVF